jgi:glutathione S-transferase
MPRPVLWHLPISHYNEKVRWALAYKGIEHVRRVVPPPLHSVAAFALTRGREATTPVMRIDGRVVGDSTAIIAELERRFPEPPLYPADEAERRRALDLEEFFDEELGPDIRLLGYHEITRAPGAMERVMSGGGLGPAPGGPRLAAAAARRLLNWRFGVASEEAAQLARQKVLAALDRLEAELGDGEYLVGDRFTVADLTAASLFYPLVLPDGGPMSLDPPEGFQRFREPLKQRRGYLWVADMFGRHRRGEPARAGA